MVFEARFPILYGKPWASVQQSIISFNASVQISA